MENFKKLGKTLSKIEQKSINGSGISCVEWCALTPGIQNNIPKPFWCRCGSGSSSGSGGNSSNGNPPYDAV